MRLGGISACMRLYMFFLDRPNWEGLLLGVASTIVTTVNVHTPSVHTTVLL